MYAVLCAPKAWKVKSLKEVVGRKIKLKPSVHGHSENRCDWLGSVVKDVRRSSLAFSPIFSV